MSREAVKVRLNPQQLELVDRTVERGEASDREALFRRALREFWQTQPPQPPASAQERQ